MTSLKRGRAETAGAEEKSKFPQKLTKPVGSADGYCLDCSLLDFIEIFRYADSRLSQYRQERKDIDARGFFICSLGDRLSQHSECPLCRLFYSARCVKEATGTHNPYSLVVFSTTHVELGTTSNNLLRNTTGDEACLVVLPSPLGLSSVELKAHRWQLNLDRKAPWMYICRTRSTSQTATQLASFRKRRVSPKADLGIAKDWLDFCMRHHCGSCMDRKPRKAWVQNFKVIDCLAQPPSVVEKCWKEPYLALSYVWGPDQTSSVQWPAVIIDAVSATTKLGFKYLWVDRYCINQENEEEKNYLLSRMGSIYKGAEITLVAAAGSDSSHGLGGVGVMPRSYHPCVTPSNLGLSLVSSLTDARDVIRSSVWFTRGWTYQEGFLSRRRLYFTSEQMYWECNGMAISESLDVHLPSVHTTTGSRMSNRMHPGLFSDGFGNATASQNLDVSDFAKIISEYSSRNLTFDADILVALQGISERFTSQSAHPLHLLAGIPVRTGPDRFSESYIHGLTYWANTSRDRGEEMTGFKATPRRKQFPSWSWAGWSGQVTWGESVVGVVNRNSLRLLYQARGPHDYFQKPILQSHDGGVDGYRVVSDSLRSYNLDQPNTPSTLTFKDPYVMRELQIKSDGHVSGSRWFHRGMRISVGLSIDLSITALQEQLKEKLLLAMLTFVATDNTFNMPRIGLLLLRGCASVEKRDTWERIGRIILEDDDGIGVPKVQWSLEKAVKDLELFSLAQYIVVE